jgi:hypothetical protein
MNDKVTSLFGAAPPIAQVEPRVVARLEGLLALARDGQICGIAWVAVDPFGGTKYGRAGSAEADRMIASTARLFHDMLADSREAADGDA